MSLLSPATDSVPAEPDPIAARLVADMERQYGPLLGGVALYRALGLPSAAAFRQAVSREALPVQVFAIPHRRGRFALTREVALWLARLRTQEGDCLVATLPMPARPLRKGGLP